MVSQRKELKWSPKLLFIIVPGDTLLACRLLSDLFIHVRKALDPAANATGSIRLAGQRYGVM